MHVRGPTPPPSGRLSTGSEANSELTECCHWTPTCPGSVSQAPPRSTADQSQHVLYTDTHTRLTAPFRGQPGYTGTRKVKRIWILLKQETVSGSGISWVVCKSASRSRQITTPAPHHSVFYRPDALPATQPTASKH